MVVVCPNEKPGAILTWVQITGGPRVNFHCRLSYSVCTAPCVQSHASTLVCMLKIPNAGSRTIVWTHKNAAHTDRNGQRCSCGCCANCKLLTDSRSLRLTVSRPQCVQRTDDALLTESRSLRLTVSRPQCVQRTDDALLMGSRSLTLTVSRPRYIQRTDYMLWTADH